MPTPTLPCPACQQPAYYWPQIDRYVHANGSDNAPCWLAFTRGTVARDAQRNAVTRRIGAHGWGPWRLDPELLTLTCEGYEIDLEECLTPAAVLDWICQVAGKSWADDETLACLVRALDDILTPQATLCSWGRAKRLTRTKVRQLCATINRERATL
jgi:hypothetical protein